MSALQVELHGEILLGSALRVSDWSLTTIGSGLVDDRPLSPIEGHFAAAKAASWPTVV